MINGFFGAGRPDIPSFFCSGDERATFCGIYFWGGPTGTDGASKRKLVSGKAGGTMLLRNN